MHWRRSLAHIQYHIKGCEIEYKSYWPFKIDYENKKALLLSALRLGSGALILSSAKAWSAPGSQPMPLALGLEIKSQIHKKYTAEPGLVGVMVQWYRKRKGGLHSCFRIAANTRTVISDGFANELLTLTL